MPSFKKLFPRYPFKAAPNNFPSIVTKFVLWNNFQKQWKSVFSMCGCQCYTNFRMNSSNMDLFCPAPSRSKISTLSISEGRRVNWSPCFFDFSYSLYSLELRTECTWVVVFCFFLLVLWPCTGWLASFVNPACKSKVAADHVVNRGNVKYFCRACYLPDGLSFPRRNVMRKFTENRAKQRLLYKPHEKNNNILTWTLLM